MTAVAQESAGLVERPAPDSMEVLDPFLVEEQLVDLDREGGQHAFAHDVAVVGLGYVGLPTALGFLSAGRRVLGVDISTRRLADVRSGRVDLLARDRERLAAAVQNNALDLTSDLAGVAMAHAVLVCVPTPVDEQLVPDLTALKSACAAVVRHVRPGQVVVLTSTSYVGCTNDLMIEPLERAGLTVGVDVFVAFSPERIDPGNRRFSPEDVPRVVGGATPRCTDMARTVLAGHSAATHAVSSVGAAEMSKLVENTFRAVNIALANEFADVGRALDLDITEVIDAAATKPFGFMPFRPGPGVGGHCIPCDPHYLLWQLRGHRVGAPVIEQAMRSIAERPTRVVDRILLTLADKAIAVRRARLLVVGVTYKPDIEDLRESPALEIIERLADAGADVSYFDPFAPALVLKGGRVLRSLADLAAIDADGVVVHTRHSGVNLEPLRRHPVVIDATFALGSQLPHAVRV